MKIASKTDLSRLDTRANIQFMWKASAQPTETQITALKQVLTEAFDVLPWYGKDFFGSKKAVMEIKQVNADYAPESTVFAVTVRNPAVTCKDSSRFDADGISVPQIHAFYRYIHRIVEYLGKRSKTEFHQSAFVGVLVIEARIFLESKSIAIAG